MINKPDKIITHHAVSLKTHTAEDVDDWHKQRWPGFTSKVFKNKRGQFYHVGYHYVIEWDGTIVRCRAEDEEGAHCFGQNRTSIGICLMGNNDVHKPSIQQMESFEKLYREIQSRWPAITPNRIFPHRKYANKSCHGKLLADDYYTWYVATKTEDLYADQLEKLRQLLNQLKVLLSGRRMK